MTLSVGLSRCFSISKHGKIRYERVILLKSKGQNCHLTARINLLDYVKFGIHCMTVVWFWLFVLGLLFFLIYSILVVLNFGLNFTNENLEKLYWS